MIAIADEMAVGDLSRRDSFRLMSLLCEAYDREHLAPIPVAKSYELLDIAMEAHGLRQTDMIGLLGDAAAVSSILGSPPHPARRHLHPARTLRLRFPRSRRRRGRRARRAKTPEGREAHRTRPAPENQTRLIQIGLLKSVRLRNGEIPPHA